MLTVSLSERPGERLRNDIRSPIVNGSERTISEAVRKATSDRSPIVNESVRPCSSRRSLGRLFINVRVNGTFDCVLIIIVCVIFPISSSEI